MSKTNGLPREGLFRALPDLEMRAADEDGIGVLTGHFLRFNEWATIRSAYEGNFVERIAPGAADKTLREGRNTIRSIFQHGFDPQVGDKPLGPFRELREDDEGVYYEVPLLDTSYNRDLIPGLKAGLYGASFKFRVLRESIDDDPERSDYNPDGLQERTITEMQIYEGGPVTYPAYANATAGIRSLTDEFLIDRLAAHPERLREIVEARKSRTLHVEISGDADAVALSLDAPSDEAADPPVDERREQETKSPDAPPAKGTRKVKDYLHGGLDLPRGFLP
jgi:HK97 family phage prohead protease